MTSDQPLSFAAEDVRRHDRERFVTALFAPAARREGLLVLYAFNLELARVRENVHEAMAGMIRLQWWREVLSGRRDDEAARHPVAGPLLALARSRDLSPALFEQMLTARELDLIQAPFATAMDFAAYARQTSAVLSELAAATLGAGDEDSRAAARSVGEAWAVTGLLRAVPAHLAQGWLTLPQDVLLKAGTSQEDALAGKAPKPALAQAVAELAGHARAALAQARKHRPGRTALPALLPATLASAHLRTLERAGWDVFDSAVSRPRPMPVRLTVNALLGRF
ncbi:MAG: squalene/phytoene synthase family protein [Magnetospirillum sp.]|nr:squalene/phytoene synthase family protein [Magnetospirillum sp.]